MKDKVKSKEGPKLITNPKIKKKLLKAGINGLKPYIAAKKGDIKQLFYKLYKIYPQHKEGSAWIHHVFPKEDIDKLLEGHFLVQSEDKNSIGLGPAGLTMISIWNTEKMTSIIKWLTISIVILTVLTLILTVINIFKFCPIS